MAVPKSGRQRILYVEDTPNARLLVRRLLTHRYDLLEAEDGLQGIEVARSEKPDLILMDINIPNLDGHEVTTRLKSILPEVPIVALTADVSSGAHQRALAAGCAGYIPKPIDPDRFEDQVASFLAGREDVLSAAEQREFGQAYQQRLVMRLEEKVRELQAVIANNVQLNVQNLKLLAQAERRARMLQGAAEIGRTITSILDLDKLLEGTVDIIRGAYRLSYAAIYLLDKEKKQASLRAGQSEDDGERVEFGQLLEVGGRSSVSMAIFRRQAYIAPQRSGRPSPQPRSEMALPLIVGDEVIGALRVQNEGEDVFSEEDATALQTVADQLAVAINNARLLIDLESAHKELVRTKTFEAIATATGEAIHWVGNKAAPVPACVKRTREDVSKFIYVAAALLDEAPESLREHKFAQALALAAETLNEMQGDRQQVVDELQDVPPAKIKRFLDVESIMEDLSIIGNSARTILDIKEDLIGPAREQKLRPLSIEGLLQDSVMGLAIPPEVYEFRFAKNMPQVVADETQMSRTFINLFKNAMEAMEGREKKLTIQTRLAEDGDFLAVDVTDTGCGISPEDLDKIWITFYTTKGGKGGTGLGLPACMQMVSQAGGKIKVESEVGVGTTFSVLLPVYKEKS